MTTNRLNRLLVQIDPWPDYVTNYSSGGWAKLMSAAKEIQSCDQNSVLQTLNCYQNSSYTDKYLRPAGTTNWAYDWDGRIKDDGKLLLLLKIVFDLPEAATNSMHPKYFAWSLATKESPSSDINSNGTFNIAWPIRWNNGQPQLVTGETGMEGPVDVYDVPGEYMYFKTHYKFRIIEN